LGLFTINHRVLSTIGKIADARVVQGGDQLTLISTDGIVLRLKVNDIRMSARATKGVRIMNLKDGATVASVARISAESLQEPVIEDLIENSQDDKEEEEDSQ
jgi:DNA gyrase subunit A